MKDLAIIDSGAYLKYGTILGLAGPQKCEGLQVGGLIALMRQATLLIFNHRAVMVAFDSKTDRKEYCPEYKANREFDSSVEVQRGLAFVLLQHLGIHCVKRDGYEADDLIVEAVNLNKDNYPKVEVYTNDMDLTQVIDSTGKISIISPTCISHDVDKDNFQLYAAGEGNYCEFNTILIHKLLFGDKSDNMGPFSIRGGRKQLKVLEQELIKVAKANFEEPQLWSHPIVPLLWLKETQAKDLNDKEFDEFQRRHHVFYPIQVTDEKLKEDLVCRPLTRKDYEKTSQVFTLLSNRRLAIQWGVELGPKTEEMRTFLYRLKNVYNELESAKKEGRPIPYDLASVSNIQKMFDEISNPVDTGEF